MPGNDLSRQATINIVTSGNMSGEACESRMIPGGQLTSPTRPPDSRDPGCASPSPQWTASRPAMLLYGAALVYGWHTWVTRALELDVARLGGAIDTLQKVCR